MILLLTILFVCVCFLRRGYVRVMTVQTPFRLPAFDTRTPTDAHVGQPGRQSIVLSPDDFQPLYAYLDTLVPGYRVSRVHAPVEHRLYFTGSSGMDWHKDQPILEKAAQEYLEGVLTVHNDSDSVFEYLAWGLFPRRVVPHKGTLVLLRPNDVTHRVTPVRRGSREILKMVFIPNSSTTACGSPR